MEKKTVKKNGTYLKNLGLDCFGLGSNSAEVDVKDGRIVRIRPFQFDNDANHDQIRPWKIEARDRVFEPTKRTLFSPFNVVYKKRAYSPNRIPYPLKRVDWDPNGERNPQSRGKSKFERISWGEATDIVANEIKRLIKEYGPYTILAQADGHGETKAIHGPHGCQTNLLKLLGGFTLQVRQPDSWEGWYWGSKHVWGQDPVGLAGQTNLLKDIFENTRMMLHWGCDPETTPWAWGGQYCSKIAYHLTDIGINSIYICPDLNYGAAIHADKWIPILPNTDAALQLAIAYVWITEGTYDQEYLDTHAVGFDKVRDYILGLDDFTPKTPKWAEERTHVPSRVIKALARKWAKEATTIAHVNGGGLIRSSYSHEPGRLEVLLLAMQGLGRPGTGQFVYFQWQLFGLHHTNAAPRSEVIPHVMGCYNGLDFTSFPDQFIPKTLIPKAILSKEKISWYGHTQCNLPAEDQYYYFEYPVEGFPRIHAIWTDTPCWTTCWNGGNEFIEAVRSPEIEVIIAQHPWFENDCLFADLVFPSNTKFEEEDLGIDIFSGCYNQIFYEGQCIESVGESMSDFEVVCEIAKKLGLYEQLTKGRSYEDMIRDGYEMSGCAELCSYEEFREKGYFVIPTAEDWEKDEPGQHAFWRDPEGNPLDTPSGKLELYSEKLAAYFPDDKERPPFPKYIPFGESHQESLLHPRAKQFPYLMLSNHPRWRMHANLDDISWFREISTSKVKGPDGYLYEPVWINPADALKKGIRDGDVVKIFNERGFVLGGALVTERVMPGAISQDHGARLDPIEAGVSDRGGANNLICPTAVTSKNCVGEVTNGFLVNFEKADLEALRRQYPEVFARSFKPSGVNIESWIKGGEN